MLHTLSMTDFRNVISDYLVKNNESIRGLSSLAGVSYSTVSKFLTQQQRNLRMDTYQKLLAAMKTRRKRAA